MPTPLKQNRSSRLRYWLMCLPFIFFLIVVTIIFLQLQEQSQGHDPKILTSARLGKVIPELTISDLFLPEKYDKWQDFLKADEPILVNVWATWCPTCRHEHDYLNQLAQQGIRIIGINYKDDPEQAKAWLDRFQNPYYAVLNDQKGMYGFDLGVYGAPETFLVDPYGVIRYRLAGELTPLQWQTYFEPLWQDSLPKGKKP